MPSPLNESTFYVSSSFSKQTKRFYDIWKYFWIIQYNPSMFDEPSEYNRTRPCPIPAYADVNTSCVDLTEDGILDTSVEEVSIYP